MCIFNTKTWDPTLIMDNHGFYRNKPTKYQSQVDHTTATK